MVSVREVLATLGAPACQHVAPADCFLPCKEAMLALALPLRWLVFDALLDEAGLENGAEDW